MRILSWKRENISKIAKLIMTGEPAIVPTDTLYGIVALASNESAVVKVNRLKNRADNKPFIVLIGQVSDLKIFGVNLTNSQKQQVGKHWPGQVSLVLPCDSPELEYLHKGMKSLAFRLPKDDLLEELLDITGPLIAPSANPAGETPAVRIEEAVRYFGDEVVVYADGGERKAKPSTLISLINNEEKTIRA